MLNYKNTNLINTIALTDSRIVNIEEIKDGATKINNQWITNVEGSDLIDTKGNIDIYIPSTIDIDKINPDFDKMTNRIKNILRNKYNNNVEVIKTKGAWKSDELNKIVYEDINIIRMYKNDIDVDMINEYYKMAIELKKNLNQEGISIGINNSLFIA